MKLTKQYIKQLIEQELNESTSRFSTPQTGEVGLTPIIDAKNKVTATIAALTMLIADSQFPTKNIEAEIIRLKELEAILDKKSNR